MITLKNCSIEDFQGKVNNRRVIPFGIGNWFSFFNTESMAFLRDCCPYVLDNESKEPWIDFQGKRLAVCKPEKLREEKECIVILISPYYMFDMYHQLEEMKLQGNIECYCFPFMTITDHLFMPKNLLNRVISEQSVRKPRIPKVIHSFWFSGDPKPKEYQRCIDTWREVCPDYKIIEWNQENYDCNKNSFVKKAIELKAWAFAADYARLDVLNRYGGIYMDMDVEVLKPLDNLLENAALLCFANSVFVDLAVMAAEKGNELIQKLLCIYESIEIPSTRENFQKYLQPKIIRKTLEEYGVKFNGKLQIINDTVFLPRTFFFPMDMVIFDMKAKSEYTYTIHYDNQGWSIGNNKHDKKIEDNRKLWKMMNRGEI